MVVPNKPMPSMIKTTTRKTVKRKQRQKQHSSSKLLVAIILGLSALCLTLVVLILPVFKGIELSLRGIRKGLGVKEGEQNE